MTIDSIVVAVNDLSAGIDDFEQQFWLAFGPRHAIPEQLLETARSSLGVASLQLTVPLGSAEPIAALLRTRGAGLSAVTLRVDNIAAKKERFLSTGLARPEAEIFDSGYAREMPLRPLKTHGALFVLREWNA
jgi:hypothetical protein